MTSSSSARALIVRSMLADVAIVSEECDRIQEIRRRMNEVPDTESGQREYFRLNLEVAQQRMNIRAQNNRANYIRRVI